MPRPLPTSTLFPYTTLFRSAVAFRKVDVLGEDPEPAAVRHRVARVDDEVHQDLLDLALIGLHAAERQVRHRLQLDVLRSEEHTSDSSHQIISYAVFCLKKKN